MGPRARGYGSPEPLGSQRLPQLGTCLLHVLGGRPSSGPMCVCVGVGVGDYDYFHPLRVRPAASRRLRFFRAFSFRELRARRRNSIKRRASLIYTSSGIRFPLRVTPTSQIRDQCTRSREGRKGSPGDLVEYFSSSIWNSPPPLSTRPGSYGH